MRKSKWTPEKTAALIAMVARGLSRREIAYRMGVAISGVTAKLFTLDLAAPLNPEGYRPSAETSALHLAKLARFPRFEDITLQEAAAVRCGAPASAPFARDPNYSLTGNAAALCAFEACELYVGRERR